MDIVEISITFQLDYFQAPFNKISYEIIGDDTATVYFKINTNSGAISLKSSVNGDRGTVYKVRVRASDGGTPPKTDTAVVTVNVQRNLKLPNFSPNSYEARILETQDLGVPFVQVKAKDDDQKPPYNTFVFEITGDQEGMEYFMVDAVTGQVAVKKGLYLDTRKRTQYNVRHLFHAQPKIEHSIHLNIVFMLL